MPMTRDGKGGIEFVVSSVVLVPAHTETPIYSPENPNPEPIQIPESVTATLTPLGGPTAQPMSPAFITPAKAPTADEAVVTGSIVISTQDINAFAIGEVYMLTLDHNA